nr:ATP-dependent helicase HrpB [Pseudenhygromyxa sp. WMMC2535]
MPIAALLPALREPGRAGQNLVIEAPPGAGKTTGVPPAVLERLDAQGDPRALIVLQPRRLAARMSAQRVAALLGEQVGERVGYRVRFESAGSKHTRIWFMTEGVLLRRLREDPELEGVAAVILDEFHERSLDADLLLAMLRRLQRRREDPLELIVMSATLDAEPVADYLGAERLRSEGRSFPVEVEYRSGRSRSGERPLEAQVAAAVLELIESGVLGEGGEGGARGGGEPGHALVFLPGAREIRACAARCAALVERAGVELHTLHGQLPREQQDRAVAPSARSKLILSTNVAETSITVDGVVAVIDSGLARVADLDPGTGLSRLELRPISRASAAQRAGRAGRTRPGICLRLYSRHDHDHRPAFDLPQIARLDLSGALLELAAVGVHPDSAGDAGQGFAWFEAPPEAALSGARGLLESLGALGQEGALTDMGRAMLRYPLHPRLARLLVAGVEGRVGAAAAGVAALLAERALRRPGTPARRSCEADVIEDLELLDARRDRGIPPEVDPGALAAARRAAEQLRKLVAKATGGAQKGDAPRGAERDAALRLAVLAAHPDRVAKVRVDEHDRRELVFASGGSARLAEDSGVRSSWAVALRSEARREGTRRRVEVRSACAIAAEWLLDLFPDAIEDDEQVYFDAARERVVGESALRYGKLAIESSALSRLPPERATAVLREAARAAGAARFCPEDRGVSALDQLRHRAALVHRERGDFPILDDARVAACLDMLCEGRSSFAELEQANLLATLAAELGTAYGDPRVLDRLAPARVGLAGGRKLTIHYEPDRAPWVGSRLQDFFGTDQGPRILDGELPVVLHLRAPNRHDVAVTTDLAGFWREHYPQLRQRLSRRYPKHDWPEDPLSASPPAPRGPRRGGRRR